MTSSGNKKRERNTMHSLYKRKNWERVITRPRQNGYTVFKVTILYLAEGKCVNICINRGYC